MPAMARRDLKLLSVAEQQHIVAELQRALASGDPKEQMRVVTWASQYADYYFKTGRGNLQRVFPKGKLLLPKLTRSHHATSQSKADLHRAQ